jgi:hypothetical protein
MTPPALSSPSDIGSNAALLIPSAFIEHTKFNNARNDLPIDSFPHTRVVQFLLECRDAHIGLPTAQA